MSDFFQTGNFTTLHRLAHRPLDALEKELRIYSASRPMALILPSLFSELEGPALPRIVEDLKQATYLSDIVVGLDRADARQFDFACEFFSGLPQRLRILWNDGERLTALDEELKAEGLSPQEPGKGRNVWFCMGYVLACDHIAAVGLHDCDIVTYQRELPARLLYPLVHPHFDFKFSKGYYARIHQDRLSGRVTRLFVTPLLRAMKKILGSVDYLQYLDGFRYPLSGEFALSRDLLANVRIPSDWGLEIGVLSEVYRNSSRHQICQVDIADEYDHKHQDLSREDRDGGLARMSRDIAKAVYRKLATEGVPLPTSFFRTLKATYLRIALDFVEMYYCDARLNGLSFDRHREESAIEVFQQSIVEAGEQFLANPLEVPFIPNWNRVQSAMPDFSRRLYDAVEQDNR